MRKLVLSIFRYFLIGALLFAVLGCEDDSLTVTASPDAAVEQPPPPPPPPPPPAQPPPPAPPPPPPPAPVDAGFSELPDTGPAGPFIEGIDPAIGVPGELARVRGYGFGAAQNASTLTFNGVTATAIAEWHDNLIVVTIPADATSGDVIATVEQRPSNAYPYTISMPNAGADFEDPECVTIGVTPKSAVGIPGQAFGGIGALYFKPDGSELWVASDPAVATTEIWAIPVERDPATNRIRRFLPAHRLFGAPNIDSGLDLGPGGRLFYTLWPTNLLGQIVDPFLAPALATPAPLETAVASVGGIHFDPARLGADVALLSGFGSGVIATYPLTADAAGNYLPGTGTVVLQGISGPEGVHFMTSGINGGKLMVNAWSGGQILLYDWPPASPAATPQVYATVTSPYGLEIDPLTGDLFFSAIEPVTVASGIYHVANCQ